MSWLAGGAFELVICPALLAEVKSVLTERPRMRRWIDLGTALTFVETIQVVADFAEDPIAPPLATRDVKDDYIVALGRAEHVNFIVSGDKDLLDWQDQQPPVVTPAMFEEMLNQIER